MIRRAWLLLRTHCNHSRSAAIPHYAEALLTLDRMDTGVVFFHKADERAYFQWLERISCVATIAGGGKRGLVVKLKRRLGQDDLRQFLTLGHRYGFDMRQLAKVETDANRDWFRNPRAYWHDAVFGVGSGET